MSNHASNGPKLSVCLGFDFDAISLWIGSMGSTSPSMMSRGEFGAAAIPRILDLLKRYDVRATFCVPGDRKSTRLNSSHANISYAVFCLKKKKKHRSY